MAKNTGPQKSEQEKAAERGAKKVAAFKKLGNKRMPRALEAIARVAALGNKRSYTYDDKQRDKIIADLEAAVGKVRTAFNTNTGSDTSGNYGL